MNGKGDQARLRSILTEGFKAPHSFGRGGRVAENIEVAVVRAHLEVSVVRAIPLVQQFLDEVIVIVQSKAHRTLVCF